MRGAWRAADIRSAEACLLGKLPNGVLMGRAAAGLARRCALTLRDRAGGVYGSRVLVLAGPGNNGGDALYAGAALAGRGAVVTAAVADPSRLHPGGAAALRAAGGVLAVAADAGGRPRSADLVLDGLLGIGARGSLRRPLADLVATAEGARGGDGKRATMIAVDVPSGVTVDTGEVLSPAVSADVTVTFGALKPGLVVGAGAVHSGLVEVVDIGLLPWLRSAPALLVADSSDIAEWWPRPSPGDNKYTRGVVGLATGSFTYPGAALLSVAGALAGPAGLVRYAGAATREIRARFPPVIPTERVGDTGRVQAWVCGSGLSTDQRAAAGLRAVLATSVPVCLDADAITLLVDGSMVGELRRRNAPVVLTPHDGEFSKLAGSGPGDDRVGAALRLAARTGAVVLLKGHRTIVATPDGTAVVNPTGTAALATAGTGDVLAGLIGSLLAAGLPAERAAIAGAYVHGLAGRLAADSGPATAVDVAGKIRAAVAGLE
ncbi:MAG: NAD(P)H-hydrate dehydratase [Dactylosporangium sp.]|nr:NAD(P)H-hydrate dehydratase [Dactylosporangium sp.]NNJ61819.1 NAD(P)H-hydrate dehydratase [Dactylosporangium sp.]